MTKLDMTKAYYQVPIAPEHVHLTYFVTYLLWTLAVALHGFWSP